MQKKILIIGNSLKAYSLAKLLSSKYEIYITPASDTLKEFTNTLDIREDNIAELLEFVLETGIDLTIPISEECLKTDIVEIFNKNNLQIFAPTKDAASIVFDKAYAKKVLYKLRIPTPRFGIFEKQNMVIDYIKNLKNPFVLKTNTNNSAAVFSSLNVAKNCIDFSFIEKNKKIIIEDYVYGTPFSFYTITDGYKALPIGSSINYKQQLDGDGGQITSGMGACSPNYKLTLENEYFLMDNVIYPTLDYLEIGGFPYIGILGINGVLQNDGTISILGYQAFMNDTDAYIILNSINENLYDLFISCTLGSFSDEYDNIQLNESFATSLVLSNKYRDNTENIITGLEDLEENTFVGFYPDVKKNKYLEYEAPSKEVLLIATQAPSVSSSTKKMYKEAENINFKGLYCRTDICKLNIY